MSEQERIENLREELETEETPTTEEAPETETPEEVEEGEPSEESDFEIPEKFKGKSNEEIIKSYQELEKLIGQRTLSKQERSDLKDSGLGRGDLGNMDELKELIEKTDFTNMDPKQFTEFILGLTDKRAEERAQEIYKTTATVQQAVKTEIQEATDEFPLLKSNKEFRELTLAVIEADAVQGKVTPIKEACKKVSALLQIQKQEKENNDNKETRKRTAVEKNTPATKDKPQTDQERVVQGILNAGSGSGALGGL